MDPIADLLSTIKNCQMARKNQATFFYSKLKEEVLKILAKRSVIDRFEVKKDGTKANIIVYFKPGRKIYHLQRISKPGRRVYQRCRDLRMPPGLGFQIISTPRGVVDGREAKKLGLGGEVICEIR